LSRRGRNLTNVAVKAAATETLGSTGGLPDDQSEHVLSRWLYRNGVFVEVYLKVLRGQGVVAQPIVIEGVDELVEALRAA
jgi:hypothetical protein